MFKAIKVWQLIVVGAIVLGAGAYGVYALVIADGDDVLADDQQVIPVQLGDLINRVSTNGSLLYPIREVLTFGSQGTVAEVLVSEGDAVEEGQPLAILDAATIVALEQAVAQASIALADAEDALAAAPVGYTPLQLAQAEAKVTSAKLALLDAEDAAAAAIAGPTDDDIARAAADVAAAVTTLANETGDLSVAGKEGADDVVAAQDGLADATGAYEGVFRTWLGIELSADEVNVDPATLLSSWDVELEVLFDRSTLGSVDPRADSTPIDDPSTAWNEREVYYILVFLPGEILATCDGVTVPPQGACVQLEMDDAWDAYRNATTALEAARTSASKSVASAEAAITKAVDALADAEEALGDLLGGADALVVSAQTLGLTIAQESLAQAELGVATLRERAPLELALLEAQVESARLALDLELERLDASTLRAPMAGLTTFVDVAVGDAVNRNTPIVEIVDPTVVELDGVVDEIDVLFVSVGAEAEVTMDALPGAVLFATVSSIATVGVNQQGVVSYPIRIRLQVPRNVGLREGLSATADIVIRRENNVVLVPLAAVTGSFDAPVIQVVNASGGVEERPVVLGNNDEFWVAVREGLSEGERVVLQGSGTSTEQFDFRQAFRQFGNFGGGGGGGGRRGGDGGGGGGGGDRGRGGG